MTSWIQAGDTLYLWMVVVLVTAIAITIEQKWKWGARISSCVMCIAGGMILANLKIIPFTSPVYDSIGNILYLLFLCCSSNQIFEKSTNPAVPHF